MKEDFKDLQVEENLEKIFIEVLSTIQNPVVHDRLLDLVRSEVKGALITQFSLAQDRVQEQVKNHRRKLDNDLLKAKCSKGPIIHNFTEYEIPEKLSKFMEDGLNNVPEVTIDKKQLNMEVDEEIKLSCRNLFCSVVGYYPRNISMKCSMDAYIQSLIIQAPSDAKLIHSLVAMRENYQASIPIIGAMQNIGRVDMKKIIKLIPDNSILSPSDKNLGACLLPPLWYQKEYATQIQKGGYELQNIDENQCIRLLLKKSLIFGKISQKSRVKC